VGPHDLACQDEDRPLLVELGDVDRAHQSMSSSDVLAALGREVVEVVRRIRSGKDCRIPLRDRPAAVVPDCPGDHRGAARRFLLIP